MKKKIIIIFFAFITTIALGFGLFYWNFFEGEDPRMKEIEFENGLKDFLIKNKTNLHLYIVFCFNYSDLELKKYLKSGAVSSTEDTCDTIRIEQENKAHDSFYTTLPIRMNKDIEFPENFSLTALDSSKAVLKKYDKVSFNNPDKNKAGWFLNIQKIDDTIDLVSEEH